MRLLAKWWIYEFHIFELRDEDINTETEARHG